jgi:hypothetical protein
MGTLALRLHPLDLLVPVLHDLALVVLEDQSPARHRQSAWRGGYAICLFSGMCSNWISTLTVSKLIDANSSSKCCSPCE